MANLIEVTVQGHDKTGPASTALASLAKEAKALGEVTARAVKDGFDTAERSVKTSTKAMRDDVEGVATTAKTSGRKAGEALAEGTESGSGSIKDRLSAKFSSAADNLAGNMVAKGLAVGGALAGAVVGAVSEVFDRQRLETQTMRLLGVDRAAAGRVGQAAGEVYINGLVGSIEEGAAAVQGLFKSKVLNFDMSDTAIADIASQAIATATVVGDETVRIGRAAQAMVRNGMASTVSEAFDLMTAAAQRGVNIADDLTDTVTEYSVQWRKMGLDGADALGLLSQALDAGARDSDIAADAIKEFSIRAVDGTLQTAQAFEALGFNADSMQAAFAKGGPAAKAGLDQVLDALRATPDPARRAQLAVALFGTQAEDLGEALYAMDVDKAAAQLGDYAGAAEDAANVTESSADKFDRLSKTIGENLKSGAGDFLDWSTSLSDSAKANARAELEQAHAQMVQAGASKEQIAAFDAKAKAAADQLGFTLPTIDAELKAAEASKTNAAATAENTKAIESKVYSLQKLIDKDNEYVTGILSANGAQREYEASIDALSESLETNGKTVDVGTEKGRANRAALDDLVKSTFGWISAAQSQGASADQLNAVVARSREQFISLATQMGMSAGEAQTLANKLGLINGRYQADIGVNTVGAVSTLQGFEKYIANATRPRTVAVNVSASVRDVVAYAGGGAVGGPGFAAAATGGARGGVVRVNEHGGEAVRLPSGAIVIPAPSTRAMLTGTRGAATASGGDGGAVDAGQWGALIEEVRRLADRPIVVQLTGDGSRAQTLLLELLREGIRGQGGVVQQVIGS